MAKGVRAVTGGNFDHVAMILRFQTNDDEVYFVEACGNKGVAINKWSVIRKHIGQSKFYERLVYRHVEFKRDKIMFKNLEKFLNEAVGLKYGLNVKKIIRRQTE